MAGLPTGQTAWKPSDFGFSDATWTQHARTVTTQKLAQLTAQVATPSTPADRIRQRRIQEHQNNLSGMRVPFRLLQRYIGLIDREITIDGEKTGLLGRYYVDLRGPHADGDDWLRSTREQLENLGFDGDVEDTGGTLGAGARSGGTDRERAPGALP